MSFPASVTKQDLGNKRSKRGQAFRQKESQTPLKYFVHFGRAFLEAFDTCGRVFDPRGRVFEIFVIGELPDAGNVRIFAIG
jgi:hypothetical protein